MEILKNKIDFVAFVSVDHANGNGDPLNGNRPRVDNDGYGELSDVCIKRKIRNRMQDMGKRVFVQTEDRCDDGCGSLKERAEKYIGKVENKKKAKAKTPNDSESLGISAEKYAQKGCEIFLDVRSFGQVFAFEKDDNEKKGVSVPVRGPVSIHQAVSVSPVEIISMQITKSVNGNPDEVRASDTMGMKHFVRYGLYKIKGSINVQLAEKTGFTEEDAETVKECLRTLFVNDASSARPDGSMEVISVYWFRHNCKDGQYSSAKVHRSVNAVQKSNAGLASCAEDYEIAVEELPGLIPEVLTGV